jgi:acetoin utilization deacetylase AcuC-like enzyme
MLILWKDLELQRESKCFIRPGLMKIVCSETHRIHAPPYEFVGDGMSPHPESPGRIDAILKELEGRGFGEFAGQRAYPLDDILAVHGAEYLHYLERVYAVWAAAGRPAAGVIPDAFARRGMEGKPAEMQNQAGYYCFDAQTPIVEGTYQAALSSAFCALTGADLILSGEPSAYALCRPPGHHAGRNFYGGYCYLNNAAIAAARLSREDRVAILDIDYHHGNGTQDIFYGSERILYASIHAHPNRVYPFYSGFAGERGTGAGLGFNHNFPLPARVDEGQYLEVLEQAMEMVQKFAPGFLVVSAGVDTFREDPLGDFDLPLDAFSRIGERLSQARLPTLLVQEGGYNVAMIGKCVANLLEGFVAGGS